MSPAPAKVRAAKIVMTSRLLKAVRCAEPVAVVHHIPGPAPLRRLVDAASKQGAAESAVAAVRDAINAFEELIREEAGDRSSLDAILSAWLPDSQEEFEMRRKQSAFKALSERRGASCSMNFSVIALVPSDDAPAIDIVNVQGMLGLHRMRPGTLARFATRSLSKDARSRRPTNLDGEPVDGIDMVRLDQFCSNRPAHLEAIRCGDTVHYALGGTGFGPKSRSDVMLAEVNRAQRLGSAPGARPFVFHTIDTPCRKVQFDLIVHEDLYAQSDVELILFDSTLNGPASVNDPERDIDRLATRETIDVRGTGLARLRTADIPVHVELLEHVFSKLGLDGSKFRSYRYKSDYPVIGTQICMALDAEQNE